MPNWLVPVFLKGHLMVKADTKLEAITTTYHLKGSKVTVNDETGTSDLPFVMPAQIDETSVGLWPTVILDGISKTGSIKEVK